MKRTDAEILAATPPELRGEVERSLNMVRYQAGAMDLILGALTGEQKPAAKVKAKDDLRWEQFEETKNGSFPFG